MRANNIDVDMGGSAPSRALVIVARSDRFAPPRRTAWVAALQTPQHLVRGDVAPAIHGLTLPERLRMITREIVEALIATSGVLVVVIIVLTMSLLLRAIRALLHR
jgi:hypothetical protein